MENDAILMIYDEDFWNLLPSGYKFHPIDVNICNHTPQQLYVLAEEDLSNQPTFPCRKSCLGKLLQPSTPKIHTIFWQPPHFPWIKVNTDGASKGNPGPSACGAVFRNHQGYFIGGFSVNLGFQDALYAELMAIVLAIEWACKKGWNHLWLESDSIIALSLLKDDSNDPPPSPRQLRDKWMHCKSKIKAMKFYSSHIFREGNSVADFFANTGLTHSSMIWWDFPPHEDVQQLLLEDIHGVPKYRVR